MNSKRIFSMLLIASVITGTSIISTSYAKVNGNKPSKVLKEGTLMSANSFKNNGFRRILQLPNNINFNEINNSLSGFNIIRIGNGGYEIVTNNKSLRTDLKKQKGIKSAETPKPISIVNPTERVKLDKNFILNDVNSLKDATVNDPGYKLEMDIAYTQSNAAWKLVNQKREVKVAVLDTGIDYNHPDLKNRVLKSDGYNFIGNNSDPMDDNGHGTHVSGIIAAEANNGIGISGVVGTLDVKIIPVKVLDSNGEGQSDIVATGIKYAVDKGADIINLSFGGVGESDQIKDALTYAKSKGVFVVAASGNENTDCSNYEPAGDVNAYTVSAIDNNFKKASFSNYGSNVEIAAPGIKIVSTVPGGGYEAWDGTSMSAPIVSGIAAMLKAQKPSISPDEIRDALDSTAQDILTKGKDKQSGYGLINAYKAISKISQ